MKQFRVGCLVLAIVACIAPLVQCLGLQGFFSGPTPPTLFWERPKKPWRVTVEAMAVSPDGKSLLLGFTSGGINLQQRFPYDDRCLVHWNMETGEIRPFKGHERSVNYVAFLPGGQQAFSSSLDGTMRVWDVPTAKELRQMGEPGIGVRGVLSSDGRWALVMGAQNKPHLWDVATGKLVRTFDPHPYLVGSLGFSPDGKFALTAGTERNPKSVKLWEVATGQLIRSFDADGAWEWSASFTPDGKQVLTHRVREADGVTKFDLVLWDVASGEEVRVFQKYTSRVFTAAFTPDGKYLLCAAPEILNLWEVATGKRSGGS
jgi:WD40 repeat protein